MTVDGFVLKMHTTAMFIYKIFRSNEWDHFKASGETAGAPIDLADGYVHFSTSSQVKEKLENNGVLKEDFRHLGQKPSSKESAILMLADSLEAACRAIFMVEDADEVKIKNVIEEIFNEKIADDQLSKAPITFEELSVIKDSFQKSLEGLYHQRVLYPEISEEE